MNTPRTRAESTTWLDRVIVVVKLTRDLQLVALGFIVLQYTPPSLQEVGVGGAASVAWALMILVGAVVAALGSLTRSVLLEGLGCLSCAVGFGVWATGALLQPEVTGTTWAVAMLLGAGVSGQLMRSLQAVRDEDLRG